tara:strand:+ start:254 stop:910 length:657 start_codon:yes stop_codon:yes gene_type:complete
MIPKIIHQIYFDLYNKDLKEIKKFYESHKMCKNQDNFKYILWSEKDCEDLINKHYPKYKSLYSNFRYKIQKIDFIRFCILHRFGGIYIDLDMIILQPLESLIKGKKYVFHNVQDVQKNWSFIENDFMCSVKNSNIWLDLMQHCKINYKEKEAIKIYDTWVGRFIMQTTGPKFLSRYFKQKFPKYNPLRIVKTKYHKKESKNFYIEDYKMNTWVNNKSI